MSWTPERIERLKVLVSEGKSATQISKEPEFKRVFTRSAILGKVYRMGLRFAGAADPHKPGASAALAEARRAQATQLQRVRKGRTPKAPPQPDKALIAAKPKIKAADARALQAQLAKAIPFVDRSPLQCTWIFDEQATADSKCCGAKIAKGAQFSYCPEHHAIVSPTRRAA